MCRRRCRKWVVWPVVHFAHHSPATPLHFDPHTKPLPLLFDQLRHLLPYGLEVAKRRLQDAARRARSTEDLMDEHPDRDEILLGDNGAVGGVFGEERCDDARGAQEIGRRRRGKLGRGRVIN